MPGPSGKGEEEVSPGKRPPRWQVLFPKEMLPRLGPATKVSVDSICQSDKWSISRGEKSQPYYDIPEGKKSKPVFLEWKGIKARKSFRSVSCLSYIIPDEREEVG